MNFRARPNCLYRCDPILGGAHFRTLVATDRDIVCGHISGYAVTQNVIDVSAAAAKSLSSPNTSPAETTQTLSFETTVAANTGTRMYCKFEI